jgi:hypothetical protein
MSSLFVQDMFDENETCKTNCKSSFKREFQEEGYFRMVVFL